MLVSANQMPASTATKGLWTDALETSSSCCFIQLLRDMANNRFAPGMLRTGKKCVAVVYNPVTKQFFGRSFHSWGKV